VTHVHEALARDFDQSFDLGFRSAVVRVGIWLGWVSIAVVLGGLALDAGARHRWLVLSVAVGGAAATKLAMRVPWREWLPTRRGRALLDLWSGGLIGFVAVLVAVGGASFAVLLFLAVPFIALVQTGWRRGFWLAVSVATCALVAAFVPLSAAATAMRLALVGAAVGVALLLARTIQGEAGRAALERALAKEASHRVKNDLQAAADLLLLGRPDNGDARAFDETAARVRSIAAVHRLLAETNGRVDAADVLREIADAAPGPVTVDSRPLPLGAAAAQKLGIVANELITNAFRHGRAPVVVRLSSGRETLLRVEDHGDGPNGGAGLGLELVRRLVEQGLGGRFAIVARPDGGTRAEVAFPAAPR
jgi:two-component sensor histidine kinase